MAEMDDSETYTQELNDVTQAWKRHIESVLYRRDEAIIQMQLNRTAVEKLEKQYREITLRQGYIFKELQVAFASYSQLLFRPLCEAVYTKLPRELRDRIYGYLLGPRPDQAVPLIKLINRRRQEEKWFSQPWVGQQFSAEICEMAYRTDHVQLCGTFNLQRFLLEKGDNGVLPAEHIRSLDLRVNLDYRTCLNACCGPSSPYPRLPTPPLEDYTPEELKHSIVPLSRIKNKRGFNLKIIFWGYLFEERFFEIFEAMKPLLLELKQEGMNVCFTCDTGPYRTNRFPEDMTNFLEEPREEWGRLCKEHRQRLRSAGVSVLPESPTMPPLPLMRPPPPPQAGPAFAPLVSTYPLPPPPPPPPPAPAYPLPPPPPPIVAPPGTPQSEDEFSDGPEAAD